MATVLTNETLKDEIAVSVAQVLAEVVSKVVEEGKYKNSVSLVLIRNKTVVWDRRRIRYERRIQGKIDI